MLLRYSMTCEHSQDQACFIAAGKPVNTISSPAACSPQAIQGTRPCQSLRLAHFETVSSQRATKLPPQQSLMWDFLSQVPLPYDSYSLRNAPKHTLSCRGMLSATLSRWVLLTHKPIASAATTGKVAIIPSFQHMQ